jgi:predicted dehydrogenase
LGLSTGRAAEPIGWPAAIQFDGPAFRTGWMQMTNIKRLRVGVIGCGGIAQMMHLPFLFSLPERYEIAALSDLSPGVLEVMGARFQVPPGRLFSSYQDLVTQDLDAVLVLTGGDHYAPVLAALRSDKHVLVEKPLCFSLREADELIAAAEQAQVKLQVGYMKRYDPGYLYAQQRLAEMQGLRYVQINTLHPSEEDYLRIHNLVRFNDVPGEAIQRIRAADSRSIAEAIGQVSPALQAMYTDVLLGSMVHDINALRGLLGEPGQVLFTDLWPAGQENASVTTVIQYPAEIRVVYTWTYLNDLRDYFEEIALMSPGNRLRIQWPSPYLKHFPTPIVFQGMEDGTAYEKRVLVSYDEAFRRELIAFYENIVNNLQPLTGAADAREDIRWLQRIFAALHPVGLGGEAAAQANVLA